MNRAAFRQLVLSLPQDAPCFGEPFGLCPGQPLPTESERLTKAESERAFLWHLADSYARQKRPLPEVDLPESVQRAYRYQSDPAYRDPDLALAVVLSLPDNRRAGDLANALSLCPDGTQELIAEVFGYPVAVISLYQELFYDVEGLRTEPLFRLRLLVGTAITRPGQEQLLLGERLTAIALKTGQSAAVLAAAGISIPGANPKPVAELAEQIKRDLFRIAKAQLTHPGGQDPRQNRALALVIRYFLRHEGEQALQPELAHGLQVTPDRLQTYIGAMLDRLALQRPGSHGAPGAAPGACSPPRSLDASKTKG